MVPAIYVADSETQLRSSVVFLDILEKIAGKRPPEPTKILPKTLNTCHFQDNEGIVPKTAVLQQLGVTKMRNACQ